MDNAKSYEWVLNSIKEYPIVEICRKNPRQSVKVKKEAKGGQREKKSRKDVQKNLDK